MNATIIKKVKLFYIFRRSKFVKLISNVKREYLSTEKLTYQ